MKQVLSTKIDDDLNEIVNEICSRGKITRSKFFLNAIKHYISASSACGIPSLDQPDVETKVYTPPTEEEFEKLLQIRSREGKS